MKIHLADGSNERGQYNALLSLNQTNQLLSYAYKRSEKYFEPIWEGQLRIFLAGIPSKNNVIQDRTLSLISNHLTTYADIQEVNDKLRCFDTRSNVLIDSGAFTAFTKGKFIDPFEYAKWAIDFSSRWESKMSNLNFMNLDVIGDQDASWTNQSKIESTGLKVLPIVTYNADLKHLDRALNYPYFALGGLVPYAKQAKILRSWLDACFSRIMKHKKATGVMPKVHILGITRDWVCERYPIYSCDSSSWTQCVRFGAANRSGLGTVPRYKESEGALSANIEELCSAIKFYQKMERDATNLWEKRGIRF